MEPPVGVVLLAGGSGSRISREVNKVYLPVAGRRVLEYSLDTVLRCRRVIVAVLVIREADGAVAREIVDAAADPRVRIITGGPSRAMSERAGLEELAPLVEAGDVEIVAVHDGARPFATVDLFERVVAAAAEHGGALPTVAVTEILYEVDGGRLRALDPQGVCRVQTPQAFRAEPLVRAFRDAAETGFEGVDTAETVEVHSDLTVVVVPGEPDNVKLTFVGDLFGAEDLATRFTAGRWVPPEDRDSLTT